MNYISIEEDNSATFNLIAGEVENYGSEIKQFLIDYACCKYCRTPISIDFSPCRCQKDSSREPQDIGAFYIEHEIERFYTLERSERRRVYAKNNGDIRRIREYQSEGFHTDTDIKDIRSAQKNKCYYCGVSLDNKTSADHIKPLADDGTQWPNNIAITCRSCNRKNIVKMNKLFSKN